MADNVSLAKTAAGIYGSLFNQAWDGLAGAGQYLGYYAERNQPSYPTEYIVQRGQFQQGRIQHAVEATQRNIHAVVRTEQGGG